MATAGQSPVRLLTACLSGRAGYRAEYPFSRASGRRGNTGAMNIKTKCPNWIPALLVSLGMLPGAVQASPYLDGVVAYDYYVSGVDAEGYEWVDADLYAQRVVNDAGTTSGPLSLSGWLTRSPGANGAGIEAGYLPIGKLAGYAQREVDDSVPADDVRPGEYYVNMLLQDERYPGSYDDSRGLPPTLLWRGGLEAIGPVSLYQNSSGWLDVDFKRVDNRRLDGKYTKPITLRLFATYGFGPASDGVILCEKQVAGMYAGDSRYSPGFRCYPDAIPDGEYTLHLEVAEVGGRGGYSTLTGPDAYFRYGWVQRFYGCDTCYSAPPVQYEAAHYAGSLGLWTLVPLLMAGLRRSRRMLQPLLAAMLLVPALAVAAPGADDYSQAELDQMLAPIALYPDRVLSNVLIAATYPLEVAQAARWARQHPDLEGEDAVDAVEDKDWDASVKALVAVPEVLERMDEDLDWTHRVGEAFLAQDALVMDRIQVLRRRADSEGHLKSAEHVQVVREREIIYIEPTVRERIYVPYYNPWIVYGSWWWPAYPPHGWSYWGGHPVAYYHRYHAPFYWSAAWGWSGVYFSAFNWHRHSVVVVPRYGHSSHHYRARDIARHEGAQRWHHDESHRRVDYRHQRLSHRSEESRVQRQSTISRERQRGASSRSSAAPASSRESSRQRDDMTSRGTATPRSESKSVSRTERRSDQASQRDERPVHSTPSTKQMNRDAEPAPRPDTRHQERGRKSAPDEGRSDRTPPPERMDRSGRAERQERPDRAERNERPERAERKERSSNSRRGGGSGGEGRDSRR